MSLGNEPRASDILSKCSFPNLNPQFCVHVRCHSHGWLLTSGCEGGQLPALVVKLLGFKGTAGFAGNKLFLFLQSTKKTKVPIFYLRLVTWPGEHSSIGGKVTCASFTETAPIAGCSPGTLVHGSICFLRQHCGDQAPHPPWFLSVQMKGRLLL